MHSVRVDRRNFLVGALSTGALVLGEGSSQAEAAASSPREGDWLLDPSPYKAKISRDPAAKQISLSNGLVQRVFCLGPNVATIGFDNLMTGSSELRAVRPEAVITLNDYELEVGGLQGQLVQNYFSPDWLPKMTANPRAFLFDRVEEGKTVERFPWKRAPQWSTQELPWPPPGVSLTFHYKPGPETPLRDILVRVHYELYDGVPVLGKWFEVENRSHSPIVVNAFKAEVLALAESAATKFAPPQHSDLMDHLAAIHIETDYAFGGNMSSARDNLTVKWKIDPQYHNDQLSLLECAPPLGPEDEVAAGGTFRSFTVFELMHDSTELERRGLAMRRMMTTLAPWVQENPMYMHIRYAEPAQVKMAIDQCADVGFEMVMLTYGSGFDIQKDDAQYLNQMKELAQYARGKGIAIGGYTLLAGSGGKPEDQVIDIKTGLPGGGKFGPSPCLCSQWAEEYFKKVHAFLTATGMNVFLNDGSYPGDLCASTRHPGHRGYRDSQWKQWKVITALYRWCREQGFYLKVPDWYFLNGQNKTGMGYNEFDWSQPREYQTVIERQDIYDGSWEKTPSMGWMHVPLVQYHSGGEAATVEPLGKNLEHYETRFADLLGAGVQATWRGTRLYDSEETRQMVKRWVDFYKKYRRILDSDTLHLRRADGRDWDGLLHVDPGGKPCGMAFLYNPLDQPITREITLSLYYTGLTDRATIQEQEGEAKEYSLDRRYRVRLSVTIPARGRTWLKIS